MKRYLGLILIFLTFCTPILGQMTFDKESTTFKYKNQGFEMEIVIFSDSTYSFEFGTKNQKLNGNVRSTGKWFTREDTLFFHDFKPPYYIDTVEEYSIDSIAKNMVIDISMKDTTCIPIRTSDYVRLYVENRPTNVWISPDSKNYYVYDFPIWTNYNTTKLTDKDGRVVFNLDSCAYLQGDFFKYKIQNEGTNYIKVYLEKYPDIEAAEYLRLDKWLIQNKELISLKMDMSGNEIKLKKK